MCKFLVLPAALFLIGQNSFAGKEDPSITTLEITSSKNAELLPRLAQFPNLEKLTINCLEDLKALPEDIGTLKKLRELNMDNGNGCSMAAKLPETIGNLSELQTLILAGAQDNRVSGTKKTNPRPPLPKSLAKLTKLETLDLSRNGYTEIPAVVAKIPNLKHLLLEFNSFEKLPNWLKTSKIETISLSDNVKISCHPTKQKQLTTLFPKIKFEFRNEYDCP